MARHFTHRGEEEEEANEDFGDEDEANEDLGDDARAGEEDEESARVKAGFGEEGAGNERD